MNSTIKLKFKQPILDQRSMPRDSAKDRDCKQTNKQKLPVAANLSIFSVTKNNSEGEDWL